VQTLFIEVPTNVVPGDSPFTCDDISVDFLKAASCPQGNVTFLTMYTSHAIYVFSRDTDQSDGLSFALNRKEGLQPQTSYETATKQTKDHDLNVFVVSG
jgi:hypothetical protein